MSASGQSGITVASGSDTVLFSAATDGGKVAVFRVACRLTSAAPVKVNVPGLHKTGEYVGIDKGQWINFQLNGEGIARVIAQGDGGTATIDCGVVQRLY
jgi:hypothetical protein